MQDAKSEASRMRILPKAGPLALAEVSALIVGQDRLETSVTCQMLRGFGLTRQTIADSADDAKNHVQRNLFDLCFIEFNLPGASGAELTRWIRLRGGDNRHAAILMLVGLTRREDVIAARDSGAHMVIKKPTAPGMLFDRIAWAAKGRRFIDTETYLGPDRRFRNTGPPDGMFRRSTDLKGQLGDAVEPNLAQSDIDALLRPSKVIIE